jgi:DNA primase
MQLPRISREQIDAIKSRVDLARVVAERGIALHRRGRHLFALCPFHSETTPSFVVTPGRELFHCFGCGVAGDVLGFLVRYDRLSFPEAVRTLAARAGVSLEPPHQSVRSEDLCGRSSWR